MLPWHFLACWQNRTVSDIDIAVMRGSVALRVNFTSPLANNTGSVAQARPHPSRHRSRHPALLLDHITLPDAHARSRLLTPILPPSQMHFSFPLRVVDGKWQSRVTAPQREVGLGRAWNRMHGASSVGGVARSSRLCSGRDG